MNQTELLKEIYEEYEEIVKNALKILAKYVSSYTTISAMERAEKLINHVNGQQDTEILTDAYQFIKDFFNEVCQMGYELPWLEPSTLFLLARNPGGTLCFRYDDWAEFVYNLETQELVGLGGNIAVIDVPEECIDMMVNYTMNLLPSYGYINADFNSLVEMMNDSMDI